MNIRKRGAYLLADINTVCDTQLCMLFTDSFFSCSFSFIDIAFNGHIVCFAAQNLRLIFGILNVHEGGFYF